MAGNDTYTKLYAQLGGDATGSHDITLNGGVVLSPDSPYTSGGLGSFRFDSGSSQYASAADSTSFALGSGDFTIQGWIYQDTIGTAHGIAGHEIDDDNGWGIHKLSSNRINFVIRSGATWQVDMASATSSIAAETWYFFRAVRSGNDFSLSLDGTEVATDSWSGTVPDGTSPLYIGFYPLEGGTEYQDGNICDFEIIPGVALTNDGFTPPTTPQDHNASAVLLACRYGEESQGSAAGHELTTTDGQILRASGPSGFDGAMEFDGTSDYVSVPDSADWNLGSTYTIEFFFNTDIDPSSGTDQNIVTQYASTSNRFNVGLQNSNGYGATGGRLVVDRVTSGSTAFSDARNLGIVAGTTYHVAIVADGSRMYIYLDGVNKTTGSTLINVGDYSASLYIGYGYSGVWRYFDGEIANVRIDKGIARYTANFTPPTGPYDTSTQHEFQLEIEQVVPSSTYFEFDLASSASGEMPWFINGGGESSGDIPFYTVTTQSSSGNMPIYTFGIGEASGDIPIYASGAVVKTGDIPFHLRVKEVSSMSFFVDCKNFSSGDLTPFYEKGYESMSFWCSGVNYQDGELNFYTKCYESIPFYASGMTMEDGYLPYRTFGYESMPFYIKGYETLPFYTKGYESMPWYTYGGLTPNYGQTNGDMPFVAFNGVSGSGGLINESMGIYASGRSPVEMSGCPTWFVLGPTLPASASIPFVLNTVPPSGYNQNLNYYMLAAQNQNVLGGNYQSMNIFSLGFYGTTVVTVPQDTYYTGPGSGEIDKILTFHTIGY